WHSGADSNGQSWVWRPLASPSASGAHWWATVDAFRTFLSCEVGNRQSFEPGKLPDLKSPARFRIRSSRLATQAGHLSNPASAGRDPGADRPAENLNRRSIGPTNSTKEPRT